MRPIDYFLRSASLSPEAIFLKDQFSEYTYRSAENMMRDIHDSCVQYGEMSEGPVNYLKGSNIAGFVKVADAMMSYGHV